MMDIDLCQRISDYRATLIENRDSGREERLAAQREGHIDLAKLTKAATQPYVIALNWLNIGMRDVEDYSLPNLKEYAQLMLRHQEVNRGAECLVDSRPSWVAIMEHLQYFFPELEELLEPAT